MKIAFYKAEFGNWVDWVVATASRSKYSHCELVLSDGLCYSSSMRDKGIRIKKIELTTNRWDIFDLSGEYNESEIRQWFVGNDHIKYDYFGAFFSLFAVDFTKNNRNFCSEICALKLGLPAASTPGRLLDILQENRLVT